MLDDPKTHRDIGALLHQPERKASLLLGQATPHFRIHHETMMHVNNRLFHTTGSAIDLFILGAFLPAESMQAEQKAVLGSYDMFFSIVPKDRTHLYKVRRVAYTCCFTWRQLVIAFCYMEVPRILSFFCSDHLYAGEVKRLKSRLEAR